MAGQAYSEMQCTECGYEKDVLDRASRKNAKCPKCNDLTEFEQ